MDIVLPLLAIGICLTGLIVRRRGRLVCYLDPPQPTYIKYEDNIR